MSLSNTTEMNPVCYRISTDNVLNLNQYLFLLERFRFSEMPSFIEENVKARLLNYNFCDAPGSHGQNSGSFCCYLAPSIPTQTTPHYSAVSAICLKATTTGRRSQSCQAQAGLLIPTIKD